MDLTKLYSDLLARKGADAHGLLVAERVNGGPANPIELVLSSRKSDGVLKGIADEVRHAGKEQLDPSKPALVACFLEEIYDLKELSTGSGLQRMTRSVLADEELCHVMGVAYHGETIVQVTPDCQVYYLNPGLLFRNPACRFAEMRDFKFFTMTSDTEANAVDL